MKRFSAILFLSIMLFSQTELHQLLKLPVLVQHLVEHRVENNQITFKEFIVLHYFSGNPVDDDYDRDMQLPFKTNDCLQSNTSIVIPDHPIFSFHPIAVQSSSFPILKNNWNPSSFVMDIFQPPQFS